MTQISFCEYLKRVGLTGGKSALSKTIQSDYQHLSFVDPDTHITVPDFIGVGKVVVGVASMGVILKPTDFLFDSSTGFLVIANYQLFAGDAVYLIPSE